MDAWAKEEREMRRKLGFAITCICMLGAAAGCSGGDTGMMAGTVLEAWAKMSDDRLVSQKREEAASGQTESVQQTAGETSEVYMTTDMTTDISPKGLLEIYNALGAPAIAEQVAVKISTGENGSNYLKPELIGELVHAVNGTIVGCNTAYGGIGPVPNITASWPKTTDIRPLRTWTSWMQTIP